MISDSNKSVIENFDMTEYTFDGEMFFVEINPSGNIVVSKDNTLYNVQLSDDLKIDFKNLYLAIEDQEEINQCKNKLILKGVFLFDNSIFIIHDLISSCGDDHSPLSFLERRKNLNELIGFFLDPEPNMNLAETNTKDDEDGGGDLDFQHEKLTGNKIAIEITPNIWMSEIFFFGFDKIALSNKDQRIVGVNKINNNSLIK